LYALRQIDQCLEILMGLKAGRRTRYGYERDTIHGLVDDALAELAEEIKEYVESSDTVSGRPQTQGLSDDDEEEGDVLRRGATRHASRKQRRRRHS
jgi:hypothetical protein